MFKRQLLWVGLLAAAAFVAVPASAQMETISGTVLAGSDGAAIAAEFEASWNVGDFSCSTSGNELQVACGAGSCAGRAGVLTFIVDQGSSSCTGGSPCTTVNHTYQYVVDGSTGILTHQLNLGGGGLQPLAPGYNTFSNVGGSGDQILVKYDPTNLVSGGAGDGPQVPAVGIAAAIGAVLLLGGALAWRLS